ncbi:MAG: hypothetical protein CFK49_09340 [Armatimonadetes bacterium JP3_11]|jgi:hypothetical protein|nr:MAG: hypothetical protein CFK48_01235 [Armatimonadetes bacterium CP1_7O]OYT74252.1 MAG: hypothetical protein CFK49_09340 [Armatimonadetes bacterium JP3_11]RMH09510.1 MAG: hypothetical protein D6697_03400 [Armatimonadota bacterium]
MNWTVVPRITGGLGCMLVLIVGIASGIDPLLCTIRGLIGGMVGWISGALWAYVMSQLVPPETPTAPTHADSPKHQPDEVSTESEEAA